ncbi:hypothetical protein KSD_97220 [Ktedonobacter sp. SOSP1-85]|uniref:cation:proton antiporter domain-containing protein n=1 Tax=Ktedonobacter sp. SOSP1-85 TaxID=2778367 RepID=UPI0019167DC9|nr:cation:proton antiporter [Ktedonobacter sp. SOSP1-85]GHO81951.1 hypothetical protein KSD_97220 [Ktedonobacter sp. SOSP1-85]
MLTGPLLLELIVILVVVQLFGTLLRGVGQQWVIGEIVAGLVLGPSVFGVLFPSLELSIFPTNVFPTLQTLGDIGLILYMFSLGARLDTHLMLGQSRKAIVTSLNGIVFPFVLGSALAFFLYPAGFGGENATKLSFLLMIGTAMAITAFPVLARLLSEKQLVGTKIGTLALTCAAVDDVIAWCLLALVMAIVHAKGVGAAVATLVWVLLFVACMFLAIRPLLVWLERHVHLPGGHMILPLIFLLLSAYCTNAIGIHPIFGAFLMGVILPRRPKLVSFTRSIEQVNTTLFLPLFFVYSGLRTQISLINTPLLWMICCIIIVIACAGKITGALASARLLGESWKDSLTLGILMNTRGLVELIVLNIGLDLKILSPTLFAMLVIMALVTTMLASPLLSLLGYKQQPQLLPEEEDVRTMSENNFLPEAER